MLLILLLLILGILAFFIGLAFLGAWLWNITLPYMFGLPSVQWWHILALMILLYILWPGHLVKIGED